MCFKHDSEAHEFVSRLIGWRYFRFFFFFVFFNITVKTEIQRPLGITDCHTSASRIVATNLSRKFCSCNTVTFPKPTSDQRLRGQNRTYEATVDGPSADVVSDFVCFFFFFLISTESGNNRPTVGRFHRGLRHLTVGRQTPMNGRASGENRATIARLTFYRPIVGRQLVPTIVAAILER